MGESFTKYFEAFFDILVGRVCHQNYVDIDENDLINSNNDSNNNNEIEDNVINLSSVIKKSTEKKKRNLNSDQITKLFECLSFLIK